MLNFFAKLRSERYLSAWVILVSDLVVSALSSFLSMFLLWAFIGGKSLFAPQHEWWVSLSLLYAGVFFYFFRTYRIIIRHSSLRDLGRIVMAVIGKEVLLSVGLLERKLSTSSRLDVALRSDQSWDWGRTQQKSPWGSHGVLLQR